MSQAGNSEMAANADPNMNVGMPNEHISPQQRAGEIAYMLQQAQMECRADIERVEDSQAQELFGRVAGALDHLLEALFSYQDGREDAAEHIRNLSRH